MPGPLSGQLLVSAIWSLIGVIVGGRNQIGKAQIHVPTLTAYKDSAKVTGRIRDPDDCRLQRNDTDGDLSKLSIGSQPHNFRLSRVKSEPTI